MFGSQTKHADRSTLGQRVEHAGCICEIWARSITHKHFLCRKYFFTGVRKQSYPWTASPTPSRSPSVQRWGLTSRRTRPSGRLSPGKRWRGLSKHPGLQKCRKDHLRENRMKKVLILFIYFSIHFHSFTILLRLFVVPNLLWGLSVGPVVTKFSDLIWGDRLYFVKIGKNQDTLLFCSEKVSLISASESARVNIEEILWRRLGSLKLVLKIK